MLSITSGAPPPSSVFVFVCSLCFLSPSLLYLCPPVKSLLFARPLAHWFARRSRSGLLAWAWMRAPPWRVAGRVFSGSIIQSAVEFRGLRGSLVRIRLMADGKHRDLIGSDPVDWRTGSIATEGLVGWHRRAVSEVWEEENGDRDSWLFTGIDCFLGVRRPARVDDEQAVVLASVQRGMAGLGAAMDKFGAEMDLGRMVFRFWAWRFVLFHGGLLQLMALRRIDFVKHKIMVSGSDPLVRVDEGINPFVRRKE